MSRIKSWLKGVEPGTGVLDWLELGSPEAWELNRDWTRAGAERVGARSVFPFVITGQKIDRTMYDHLVPLTAELGSDGVVRVASADLNASYVRLEQQTPRAVRGRPGKFEAFPLQQGKRPGQGIGLFDEAGDIENFHARIVAFEFATASPECRADQKIFEYRHTAEGVRDLI